MTPTKKILIISISAGSGHLRAAQAIAKTATAKFPELEVRHIDMMDYVSKSMKTAVVESYDLMAKQLPELYGFFYKKTDRPKISWRLRKLSKFFNKINSGNFFKYIQEFQPDLILCTHFFPIYALAELKKKYNLTTPISLVITDYRHHGLQTSINISHYFVPIKKISWDLARNNVPAKNITVSGIPIDPSFYETKSAAELNKKLNIQDGYKNILVLSGGHGLIDTNKIIACLFQLSGKINIFAIAGNSQKLKQQLEKLTPPKYINLNIIGWTDKIDEFMRVADVIISKPGGLTTTECMVLRKPIIAISPIPGQEEYNAEYILENKLGVIAHIPEDLLYYIENDFSSRFSPPKIPPSQPTAAEIILNELIK